MEERLGNNALDYNLVMSLKWRHILRGSDRQSQFDLVTSQLTSLNNVTFQKTKYAILISLLLQNPKVHCRVQNSTPLVLCRVQNSTPLVHCRVQNSTPLVHCRVQNSTPLVHCCVQNSTPLFHCCFQNSTPLVHCCVPNSTLLVHCCVQNSTPLVHCCVQNSTPLVRVTFQTSLIHILSHHDIQFHYNITLTFLPMSCSSLYFLLLRFRTYFISPIHFTCTVRLIFTDCFTIITFCVK